MSLVILDKQETSYKPIPRLNLYYFDDIDGTDYFKDPKDLFDMKVYSVKHLKDYNGEIIAQVYPIKHSNKSKFTVVLDDTFILEYQIDFLNEEKKQNSRRLLATFKNDFDIDFVLKRVDEHRGRNSATDIVRLAYATVENSDNQLSFIGRMYSKEHLVDLDFIWQSHILRVKKNEKFRKASRDSSAHNQNSREISITFKDLSMTTYEEIFSVISSSS